MNRRLDNRRTARTAAVKFQRQHKAPAAMVERLEKRELLADSSIVAGAKTNGSNLLDNNGLSLNKSEIIVGFSGNINIADVSKIRVFGYALNPLSNNLAQIKKTVVVESAELLPLDATGDGIPDRMVMRIVTDRLMRKGGQVWFYPGAYTDDQANTNIEQRIFVSKGVNKERFTMACRMFIPTNFNRFTSGMFAQSGDPAPNSTDYTEEVIRANLDSFMQKKVDQATITAQQKATAMDTFDSTVTKARIPHPNLRAALVSLTGTFAEAAISNFLGPKYIIVTFLDPQDSTVEVARTTAAPDGRLRTIFRPEYDGEAFQVLSAWMAHEALHQDNDFKLQEEVAAVTFGSLVNVQQAQTDFQYLRNGSKLVNLENEKLVALLTRGRPIWPDPGGRHASRATTFPLGVVLGGKPATDGGGVYTSFENFMRRRYVERGAVSGNSAGNAVLNAYYEAVTGKTATANMQFSDQIMTYIDAFNCPMFPRAAIKVAQALKLALS